MNAIYTFKIRLRVQRNAPVATPSSRKAKQWLTALRSFIKPFRSPSVKSLLTKNNTKNHPALHTRSGMICVTDEAEQGTAFYCIFMLTGGLFVFLFVLPAEAFFRHESGNDRDNYQVNCDDGGDDQLSARGIRFGSRRVGDCG